MDPSSVLAAYVPRLVEDHLSTGNPDRLLFATGTLVSADISGFTALSERLAELGHEGAEQLTDLLNRVFTKMIAACEQRGGDVIKFGGDALLVLFKGEEHARNAAIAMSRMHEIVGGSWSTDSAKRVSLGISQGAHSGTIGFSLTNAGHLELLVGGPSVSATVTCEGDAERDEILVSAATADLLPDEWLRDTKPSGARVLHHRRVRSATGAVTPVDLAERGIEGLDRCLPAALAEQVLAGVPGEHRQVVVAFLNMSGTDELFERSGAPAVHAACEQLGANVRAVLQRHAVHLLASDAYVNGTKLILTAGAPLSTDADEDHMLLALHDLFAIESPLPIRAGVNRGHVFVGDLGGPTRRTLTVMGDAVNLAARLMQAARPGQIVVGAAVLERAQTQFDTVELEPFTVKGKSKPVRASVLGEPQGHDSQEPDDHIGHIGFVGRAEELARLDRLAHSALDGSGCLVEVIGEPGIGKSRLVRETLHRNQELELHRMRGGQYARNTPFFAIRRLLHELLDLSDGDAVALGAQLTTWAHANAPDLVPWLPLLAIPVGADVPATPEADRLAEQFRRDRLLIVIADALSAAIDRPVAVLAEDVHLFDTGSVDVLRTLGGRAAEHPWFIVATHRETPGFVRSDAHVVELEPLGPTDLAELAESAGAKSGFGQGWEETHRLQEIADRAGGNPLFLLELVAATSESGGDALPENVESLVTTRIDVLPAEDRTLLREAAVAGNVVQADLIASAFERPDLRQPRRWSRLEAFLVSDRPGVYRFRHALYRDVAYGGLSYRRRREAHLAIGRTLEAERSGTVGAVAALLSDHFDRGRDRKRAWAYSVLAGDGARNAYANREAIALYQRALLNASAKSAIDSVEWARVAEALGDVRKLSGQYPQAVDAYQRSRSASHVDPHVESRLLRKVGAVRLSEGRLSQSLRWFTRAQRTAERIDESGARKLEEAEIALIRAGALHRQGRDREGVIWAQTAAEAAELAGDRLVRARAYNMLEIALRTLGRSEATSYSDLALEMYSGSGDLVGEANVLNNRGVRAYFAGDWRRAIADYERSRSLRQQAGDVVGEAMVANNIAEILCLQGRFDAARSLFEAAKVAWEASSYPIGVAYATGNLAMALARSGDTVAGMALLDRAAAMLQELGASGLSLEMAQRRVECELLARRPHSALDEANVLQVRLKSESTSDNEMLNQVDLLLGIALLRAGDPVKAASSLQKARQAAVAGSDRYVEAMCLLAFAELDEARGSDAGVDRRRAAKLLKLLDVEVPPPVTSV